MQILTIIRNWFRGLSTPAAATTALDAAVGAGPPFTVLEKEEAARRLGDRIFVQHNNTARFDSLSLQAAIQTLDDEVQATPGMDISEVDPAGLTVAFDALGLGLDETERTEIVDAWALVLAKRPA